MTHPGFQPFPTPRQPVAPSWFAKLMRRPQPAFADFELRQLLRERTIEGLSVSDVSAIFQKHRVLGRTAQNTLISLWSAALEYCLADDALSDTEVAYLASLQRLFGLSESDTTRAHQAIAHPRFKRAVAEVLADTQVTAEERDGLAKLGAALRLPDAERHEIFKQSASTLLRDLYDRTMSDGRMSDTEARAVDTLSTHLGVSLTLDSQESHALHRAALLWRIENGDLPEVSTNLNLQRAETCHFAVEAQWHEIRKQTTTVGYHSAGVSFRIARGVYYRVGATRPQRVTTEGLTQIDSGTLYITNKRVLFDGFRKNSTIRLSALLGYEVYSDGIKLEKATGRSPYLIFNGDIEIAATILGRVLAAD